MELVCIKCPRGCNLVINNETITGNLCPRGVDYAKEEMTCPMRIVTALIKSSNNVIPVKTSAEVPKDKINDVLKEISKMKSKQLKIGDIVKKNICGLGVDIVVTGEPYIY